MNELCSLIAKIIKVWLFGVVAMMVYGVIMTVVHIDDKRTAMKTEQLGTFSNYDRTAHR